MRRQNTISRNVLFMFTNPSLFDSQHTVAKEISIRHKFGRIKTRKATGLNHVVSEDHNIFKLTILSCYISDKWNWRQSFTTRTFRKNLLLSMKYLPCGYCSWETILLFSTLIIRLFVLLKDSITCEPGYLSN